MPFIVPGIGYAGLGQQTPAAQQVFRQAMGGSRPTGARRRRATPTRRGPQGAGGRFGRIKRQVARARRVTRGRSKGNKFTKGSAAAKRHMAKLRKMRRR